MSEFARRAVAYAYEVKCYSGQKLDKEVTEDVRHRNNAGRTAGRYNKNLFPNSKLLKLAQKKARFSREVFNFYTLPWQGQGVRILPTSVFMKFSKDMASAIGDFETAATDFISNFQLEMDAAMRDYVALGSMFSAWDYPDPSQAAKLFSATLNPKPIVTSGDFRVNLNDQYLEQIKLEYEREFKASQQDANQALWDRLQGVVEAMGERLSDPKAIFRDSLVSNVENLVEVMDGLNVFDDNALADFTKEVRDNLTNKSPKELREDVNVRKSQADKAGEILARMKAAGAV